MEISLPSWRGVKRRFVCPAPNTAAGRRRSRAECRCCQRSDRRGNCRLLSNLHSDRRRRLPERRRPTSIFSTGGAASLPSRPASSSPIFQGGRLRANIEATEAVYRQIVAAYVNQVLVAYADVEDALTDLHALSDQVGNLREAVSASQNYLRLAQAQYKFRLGRLPHRHRCRADAPHQPTVAGASRQPANGRQHPSYQSPEQ